MTDLRTVTSHAVHDAFALRGLEDGGGGLIRAASPTEYMGEERLRLAREVLRHLPAGASVAGIKQLVKRVLPVVSGLLRPGSAAPQEEQPLQFRS